MEKRIDSQKLLDALTEQRNDALNRLAQMTAYAQQLEEKLSKQVEPDKGAKNG